MPTVVPIAAFSCTALAAPLASWIGLVEYSPTSATAITKEPVDVDPSSPVARTTIVWLGAVS